MRWVRRTLIPLTAVVGLMAGAVPGVAQAGSPLQIIELGSLGSATDVQAVNRAGTFFAGIARTVSGQTHTVRWDLTGRVTDLDRDADSGEAIGVNDSGTVVGIRYSGTGSWYTGAVWDRRGRMTVLTAPSPGDEFGVYPAGINNDGEVAGTIARTGVGAVYAVRWDRRGVATRLPGRWHDDLAAAMAINERGDVIGIVGTSSPETHGARWDSEGRLTDLGPLPGDTASQAMALNLRGDVVGISADPSGGWHAVKWNSVGEPVRLASLPGQTQSFAYAIADDGTAVGYATFATDPDSPLHYHAVRWDRRGAVTDLGTLPGDTDSVSRTAPSRDGSIVGMSSTTYDHRHAVLWDRRGCITNLGTLPSDTDSSAQFITKNGVITGSSWGTENVNHAVIWREARRP